MKSKKPKKLSSRELNSFPYLSMTLKERLIAANTTDLTDNSTIEIDGHYWIIKPIDKNKKIK